jgi:hypothetical protein
MMVHRPSPRPAQLTSPQRHVPLTAPAPTQASAMTTLPVVFARLPGGSRRVTALRLGDPQDGTVRVFARGRTYALPIDAVSRPRRSARVRALHARLLAEYRTLRILMADLRPRPRRGR